ncbi:MAG: bacterial extracellular solute-binding protein, partial [halophilic archaeon J07HX5]
LYEKYIPDAQALRQSPEIQQYMWTGNLGPYELSSTTPGEAGDAIFERNDDYYMRDHVEESNVQVMDDGFAEAPYFERLLRDREPEQATLNERWRAGDGDRYVPDTDIIEELQQRDDTTVAEELSPFISMMFFNQRANGHPMLKSAEGRIAINSIVDKQVIVEDVKRGLEGPPAATYQPRWSQFYDDSLVTARGIGVENADIRAARDRIRELDGFSVEEV